MQCSFLHILNFPTYIVHRFMYCFSCIYCVLLHVLRLTPCIACCVTPCAWLHVRVCCVVSRLMLDPHACVLLHVLRLTPCIACCVMPCAWLHALCAVLCHALCLTPYPCAVLCHALCLTPCPVCCVVSRLVFDSMSVCHSIYPILLHACQVSFWTYIWFLKIIYPKFLWLTNRYPYFPFLLDIKSLTLLVYVQFSSDSIPFSHTLSLILDISCHFLFFISNFYPAKFVFHLHRPWLWIFPAIFS